MSKVLAEIEEYINDFNSKNDVDFAIDTIRIKFSKQHKLPAIKELGKWEKLKNNSSILHKLKRRLNDKEITSVHRLKNHKIYFFNLQEPPKYRNAMMVIFGLEQYHKVPPPKEIINKIVTTLKSITNIDICFDVGEKPKLEKLNKLYTLTQYISKEGIHTDTYYINNTNVIMLEKVIIYNKALKNKLGFDVWRFEAKITIPNYKSLALPLYDFKNIIDIARGL